jgi:glycosyltransferase involved in cell wall biosynthesis
MFKQDKTMRILFIRHTPLGMPGAMDAHALPATLSGLGYPVSIVARQGGDASILEKADVNVIEIDGLKNWIPGMRAAVREVSPHIIHVFIHAGCGLYPFLLAPVSNAKFVLDIRSPLLSSGLRRFLTRLKNRVEPIGYDRITAHSIASAWTVVGHRSGIEYVPPGVNIDAFPLRSRSMQLVTEPVRAIYIGSLAKSRQFPEFMLALTKVMQDSPMILDIYGDGSDRKTVEDIIRQAKLTSKIRLFGIIPREILFSRMVEYDIGVAYVPRGTVYDPAPPLKTVEYLAAGLATIGTDTPGNALIIRHKENGILVGGTPDDFARSLVNLAQDPDLLQHLALAARSSVISFDWRSIVQEKLIPIYESLLS